LRGIMGTLYCTKALLYNDNPDDTVAYQDRYSKLETMLNFSPKEGTLSLKGELPKTDEEEVIIEEVKNEVKKDLSFLNMNAIDLPLGLVHIVPMGKEAKYSSTFLRGIVVERTSNQSLFKTNLYKELFYRSSDSVVVVDKDRKIVFADDGLNVLKKGLASLAAKRFFQEVLNEHSIDENIFDVFSERVFLEYLKEYSHNKKLSEEEAVVPFSRAVISGTAFPLMVLSRGFDPNESIAMLNWIRMREKVPSAS